jgi:hypothetical protein
VNAGLARVDPSPEPASLAFGDALADAPSASRLDAIDGLSDGATVSILTVSVALP